MPPFTYMLLTRMLHYQSLRIIIPSREAGIPFLKSPPAKRTIGGLKKEPRPRSFPSYSKVTPLLFSFSWRPTAGDHPLPRGCSNLAQLLHMSPMKLHSCSPRLLRQTRVPHRNKDRSLELTQQRGSLTRLGAQQLCHVSSAPRAAAGEEAE